MIMKNRVFIKIIKLVRLILPPNQMKGGGLRGDLGSPNPNPN